MCNNNKSYPGFSFAFCSGVDGAFEQLCVLGKRALDLIDLFFCEAPLGIGAETVINDSFFT